MIKIEVTSEDGINIGPEEVATPKTFLCSLYRYKNFFEPVHITRDPEEYIVTKLSSSIGKSLD